MVWRLLAVFLACRSGAPDTMPDADTDDTDAPDRPCPEWEDGCPLLGEIALALAPTRITSPDAQDGFGITIAVADLDDDGRPDLALGSGTYYDDRAVAVFTRLPGQVTLMDADITLTSTVPAQHHALAAGDLDGDDVADLFVGEFGELGSGYLTHAPLSDGALEAFDRVTTPNPVGFALRVATCDTDGDGRGEPWVVHVHRGAYGFEETPAGGASGASADTRILAERGDEIGVGLACLHDADGRDTVLVSRATQDPYAIGVLRPDALPLGEVMHADLDMVWTGSFGWSAVLATGPSDLALAIGVPDAANGGWNRGSVYLFDEPPSHSGDVTGDATAVIESWSDDDRYLGAMLAIGDVDGDGFSDVLVAAPGSLSDGQRDVGSVYLFYGPVAGTLTPRDADARIRAEAEELFAGGAQIADLDADGYGDLVFGGAYDTEGDGHGAVYVFRGAPRNGDAGR